MTKQLPMMNIYNTILEGIKKNEISYLLIVERMENLITINLFLLLYLKL